MKRLASVTMIVCIAILTGCKSGLETTLSIADKIDEKYNSYVESESSTITTTTVNNVTTTRQTTVEITLNEPYYIKYNPEKEYVAMYEKADTNSRVLEEFTPNGKKPIKVIVLNKNNKKIWKVKYKGKIGYIHKSNLNEKKQRATTAKSTAKPIATEPKAVTEIPITTQTRSQFTQAPTANYSIKNTSRKSSDDKSKDNGWE